jgi:hypothetical protein
MQQDPDMTGQQMPPLQDMPGMQQPGDYSSSGGYNSSMAGRPGYLPPGADRPTPWAMQQQQQQAGAYGPDSNARWAPLPPGQQSVPYDAFAGSSSSNGLGAGMPQEASYASGYGDPAAAAAGSSNGQQQYGSSSGGGYGSSGYDPSVYGPPQPGQQQQQQQQQYEWPAQGTYGQQQPPYMQPVWYDAAGVPMAADPAAAAGQPYDGFQGPADPYMPAAGMGALPDGSPLLPGAYGTGDGSGLVGLPPLPAPADGQQQQQQQQGRVAPAQQQQQQQQGRGRNAYEQVDDWE